MQTLETLEQNHAALIVATQLTITEELRRADWDIAIAKQIKTKAANQRKQRAGYLQNAIKHYRKAGGMTLHVRACESEIANQNTKVAK
jgi:predicted deacetylase